MKNNYTIIFICSFLAAGLVCLVTGLTIYFSVTDGSALGIIIGITVTVVGAADTFVSLIVLLATIVRRRIASVQKDEITEDKKD